MASLDLSGLRPVDTGDSGAIAAPLKSPSGLDVSGLKTYDPQEEFGSYPSVIGRGLVRGATDVAGTALKGAAIGLDQLEANPAPVAMKAGGLPILPDEPTRPVPGSTVQSNPLYQAGASVQQFGEKTFPMTRAEQGSFTGQAAEAVGGMVPLVALGVAAPEIALPAGAGIFAGSSAGQTFDEAKAKGASDEDAARAAGLSALVGGGLGVLPLGAILRPVTREAPGIAGWAAAKLQQAIQSGAVFGSVAEAQHYLGQEIARNFYDPNAHYDFDPKRLAASLAAGGVLGVMHPLSAPQPSSRAQIDEFLRRAAEAPGAQQPQSATRAAMDEFLRKREQGWTYNDRTGQWTPPQPAPAGVPRLAAPVDEAGHVAGLRPEPPPEPRPAAPAPLSPDYPSLEREGGPPLEEPGTQVIATAGGEQLDMTGLRPVEAAGEQIASSPPAASPPQPPPGEDASGRETLKALLDDPRSAKEIRDTIRATLATAPAEPPDVITPPPPAEIAPTPGSREAPIELTTPASVLAGAERTEAPTPAQAEAGNYRKRHVRWQGLDIAIETEAGGVRSGIGANGQPWSVTLTSPYGYIKGVTGKDGEGVDVYLGPEPNSPHVFVVDQIDHGSLGFDEHKAMIGYPDEAAARAAFHQAFSDGLGPARIGAVRAMTVPEFKTWLAQGNLKRPVAYAEPVKQARDLAKAHGINATEQELQDAARAHLVTGTDLIDAVVDRVERGALAEDRGGGTLQEPRPESHGTPEPAAANSTGAAPAPTGEPGAGPVRAQEGGPAAAGVELGQAEQPRSEPQPVAEPELSKGAVLETADLVKLAKAIATMPDAQRANVRRSIDDLMTRMDEDGGKIAEHCLQTAAGFSIR